MKVFKGFDFYLKFHGKKNPREVDHRDFLNLK